MCRWRRVQNTYRRCGHFYDLPDQMIQCDNRYCKFSTIHPNNCGANCPTTCWQYRQFPEQYNPQLDRWCPTCEQQRTSGTDGK